jgi:uncharacterized membrane protein
MDAKTQRAAGGMPEVRALTSQDIRASLSNGWHDFLQAPGFGLVIGGLVALFGIMIAASVTWFNMPWMVYPFAIGFPLVGPFLAVGLYDVSRRLHHNEHPRWRDVWQTIWAQRRREVSWMAFVVLFVFWVWVYQVRLLMALFLGRQSFSTMSRFLDVLTSTNEGLWFLILGHIIGAALALILFSITVISIPLLLERELDMVTAMITSVRTVLASPVVMLGWGVIVTLLVIAASLPLFLGLIVVLPVLGHATWHIYWRAVR